MISSACESQRNIQGGNRIVLAWPISPICSTFSSEAYFPQDPSYSKSSTLTTSLKHVPSSLSSLPLFSFILLARISVSCLPLLKPCPFFKAWLKCQLYQNYMAISFNHNQTFPPVIFLLTPCEFLKLKD